MSDFSFGPVILDIEGTTLTSDDVRVLSHPLVGGVILFTRNFESADQVQKLVGDIREINPHLLICVDHEGGRVQRFREGFTRIPAMQKLGDFCVNDDSGEGLAFVQNVGWVLAAELIACGLDFSFTPVLDLDRDCSTIIGDRAFSDDPEACTEYARALINGLHEAGMAATGKHFPGHGTVVADSHLELPVDDRDWAEIESHDLIPFKQLANEMEAVMPAHVLYPKVDADNPAGFSKHWLQTILRQQLGFDGVIFSDDLSMQGAVATGDIFARANAALDAGCDSVLVCNDREAAETLLAGWEPTWPTQSKERLLRMKAKQVISGAALKSDQRYQDTIARLEKL
ncbi:MAG: beta-N-acetylhexosaminidase [Cellvibrionaceae bacterium]